MSGFLFQWVGLPAIVLLIGFAGGWEVRGWHDQAGQLKATEHVAQVIAQQGQIDVQAATHDQAARDQIRTVTQTIIQRVPVYVPPAADAQCVIPRGFVRLHDAAATGDVSALSDAASQSDAAPSGVALSAVASVVVDNYGTCRGTTQQLSDLQGWIAAQQKLH